MHRLTIILLPLIASGCVAPQSVSIPTSPEPPQLAVTTPLKTVEARYEVGGYFDRNLRHEPHAVYRRTQIPVNQNSVSRNRAPAVSVVPLPPSEELAAELRTQREITANLRAVQARMAEIEQAAKTQYTALVKQMAEITELRAEVERSRQQLALTSTQTAPTQESTVKP